MHTRSLPGYMSVSTAYPALRAGRRMCGPRTSGRRARKHVIQRCAYHVRHRNDRVAWHARQPASQPEHTCAYACICPHSCHRPQPCCTCPIPGWRLYMHRQARAHTSRHAHRQAGAAAPAGRSRSLCRNASAGSPPAAAEPPPLAGAGAGAGAAVAAASTALAHCMHSSAAWNLKNCGCTWCAKSAVYSVGSVYAN